MTTGTRRARAAGLLTSLLVAISACAGPPQGTEAPAAADAIETLTTAEQALSAGTYRLSSRVVGASRPAIIVTVPDGWTSGGPFLSREHAGNANVVVGFWVVGHVYGHPCQWTGTLFQPGPTVEDLANALVEVPLRNATQPADVTLDGSAGKYLEWSVPADMSMNEQGAFVDCDSHFFESWTGYAMATDRYHQGPGQVDRVWILDVEGERVVIDAASMPSSTAEELEELVDIVESIRFERDS